MRPTARTFRSLLPLYPYAVESFDLRGFDLVVSSSSAWAHGVLVHEGTVHVCYCHNPFRYAWSERDATLAGRSNDEAASPLRAHVFENFFEARPFVFVLDPARNADVIDRRHVHEKSAGQRDVTGDARAFAGDGVLRHLNHDLLTFAQQIGDRCFGPVAHFVDLQFVRSLALVLFEVLEHVGDVQERIALQSQVDESGLHPGQDLGHAPFVDVSDHRPMPRALDPELDHLALVENGDPRLVFGRVDHDLPRHGDGL